MIERFAGRFALLRLLGEGGMGQVWLARDLTTGAECAIKRLRSRVEDGAPESLRREFEALVQIRHPAVVAVHEYGVTVEGEPFLVMEYVPGLSAGGIVAPGDWRMAGFVGAEVASGLEALHRAGVTHGDLKPANVLVIGATSDRERFASVRLLDFGLAAIRRDEAGHRGTPGFAAPEVVEGGPPTPASDLYGLGATLFALLTGTEPFPGATGDDKLRSQKAGPPSSLRLEKAGIPAALTELVLRLLAHDPGERGGGARAVRRELEQIHPGARRTLGERLRSAVVVGRERELSRLERWRLPSSEGARLAFLEGDAGSGKSSLLGELAVRASLAEQDVVHLSCASLETPGGVARAVGRALAARVAATAAPGVAEPAARWLAGDEPMAESDIGMLAQAAASLAAASGGGPLFVLLDDADRLEPRSAAWMRRVALHPSASRLRWVLARRPAEATPEEERVLIEAGLAIRIELGPLAPADIGRLVAARLHSPAPPLLLEFLVREGGGHPGLTVERLLAAAAQDVIVETDSGFEVRPEALQRLARTAGFEQAVIERLALEDQESRRALDGLAACGAPLTADELSKVAPGIRPPAIERLLALGCVARAGDGRLMLRPPSLADALWQAMEPGRRGALGALALALPALPARQRFRLARDLGDLPAALAHAETSFAETPDPGLAAEAAELAAPREPSAAARWHDRAGQAWRARGRYREVRAHLERALELDPGAEERGARWVLLSTAVLRAGTPREVEAVVNRALGQGLPEGAQAQLLVNRAVARAQGGDREREQLDIDQALALGASSGDPIALGLACEMASRRRSEDGDLDGAESMATRAADAFRSAGHLHGIVRSIGRRAILARLRFRIDEAERLLLEAVEAARGLENRFALSEHLLVLSTIRAEAGRWAESREPSEQAARIALEDGRPAEAAAAFANLAQIEGLLGQPRDARRHAVTALRLTRRVRPDLEAYAWRSLAQAERTRGRLRVAERAARRAIERAAAAAPEERNWCRLELGKALGARGRWPQARALWERALVEHEASDTLSTVLLRVAAGRAALRSADTAAAIVHADRAQAWLRLQTAPFAAASHDLLRAEIAFFDHQSGEGVTAGRRALAAFAQLPAPAERAQAALDLAGLATPTSALREVVTEWAELAIRTFERLGDHRRRERTLALALEWQQLPATVAMSARESGLLERVSWLLRSLTDLDELSRRAMQAAVEQLDAERGVLLLTDPDTGELRPIAEHGAVEAVTRNEAVRYSRRVAHQVAESGGALLIQDVPSDPRANSPSSQALRLRSILCVPLFLSGRTVGAVYLDDSRRTHAFGDAERGLLQGFAHLMAVAIEKCRGHEEVQKEKERLEGENLSLRREIGSRVKKSGLVGSSDPMQKVLVDVEHAARGSSTVLITGENGTGKEMVARQLHHGGRRHERRFVEINCGAIPEALIEAEFFGILANTATGVRGRPGCFELAHGGTLFLDEVGEASPRAQVALLSAIANREVTPVGSGRPIAVDVRIVAATNRDLRRLVAAEQFRVDLFYRLNVIQIQLPPLRERKADIPSLVHHFLARFAEQQERELPELSDDFLAVLMQSDWPGNVRELQNYIERVMAMTPGRILHPDPPPGDVEKRGGLRATRARRLPDAVGEIEQRLIQDALQRARGNQSQAARELGLSEQSVRYRLRKYRLPQARQNPRPRHN